MILFRCDSKDVILELSHIVSKKLEMKSSNYGWIEEQDAFFNVAMLCDYLNVNRDGKLTGVECFGENILSLSALDYCYKMERSQMAKLSSVLIMAIVSQDEKIILAMSQWINNLSSYNLEFGRAFVESNGVINDVARRLFLHRNSVRSRLDRFYDETGMDLRLVENQKVFELCDKCRDILK